MLSFERVKGIERELNLYQSVTIDGLAEKFNVSPSTIRRDLNELAKAGVVKRTYGGATLLKPKTNEIPFDLRENENHEAKQIIGELAARLVGDDTFIFLDSTSTALSVIPFLQEKKNLRIITTSILATMEAMKTLDAQVCCTGGWAHKNTMGFLGEDCRKRALDFFVDILFIGVYAVDLDKGLTGVNEESARLKSSLIQNNKRTVILCDHTKFDKVAYTHISDLKAIDCLITDRKPRQEWIDKLQEMHVQLIYPGSK